MTSVRNPSGSAHMPGFVDPAARDALDQVLRRRKLSGGDSAGRWCRRGRRGDAGAAAIAKCGGLGRHNGRRRRGWAPSGVPTAREPRRDPECFFGSVSINSVHTDEVSHGVGAYAQDETTWSLDHRWVGPGHVREATRPVLAAVEAVNKLAGASVYSPQMTDRTSSVGTRLDPPRGL